MTADQLVYLVIGSGVLALAYTFFKSSWVAKQDVGTPKMANISTHIADGAMSFLKAEYRVLSIFVVCVAILLGFSADADKSHMVIAVSFIVGALCSGLAGYIGMKVATKANVRTTNAARKSLGAGLEIAFAGGSVMGMGVVGLGVLGLSSLFAIYGNTFDIQTGDNLANVDNVTRVITIITGFSFGASSIALFARVGGGIYTKAADVGADLVGKVEQGIPEDDPRNPATVADNVGDNVGDVAGMGADLFESYVGSIIATVALAAAATTLISDSTKELDLILFPLLVASIGIFSSIIGTFLVRTGEKADMGRLLWSLRTGIFAAGALVLVGTAGLVLYLDLDFNLFWVVLIGLVAGQLIGTASEYYTSYEYSPTKKLAEQSETGPATIMIGGLGLGMVSTVIPGVVVVVAMWLSFEFAGLYGVALAAVGMLSTLGITLATDAYGPVADNAGGIAEQASLDPEVRERTDALDSLGNTTAATGKGFAIGSAVLTALALMAAYSQVVKIDVFNIMDIKVMMGLIVGAIMPFLFAALTMQAVGRAAYAMVQEVRRQFREIKGLLEGTADADYARAVDISTQGAMKEMVLPGIIAIVVPIVVGIVLGAEALGGLLIGSIATGFLFAIMMANAGGAWDNAKKYIEAGHIGGKGSDQHSAAVVGDTVGDPFKDTSGPALNILLKLMSIVALVFGPLFIG